MRLLPDSNIFIKFWDRSQNTDEEIKKTFQTEEIVICGVVRAELLHGAVSEKHFQSMTAMFDAFEEINPDDQDWQRLGKNLYLLRTNGITVPLSDVIIATVATKHQLTVWTNDNHFRLMQSVIEGLEVKE